MIVFTNGIGIYAMRAQTTYTNNIALVLSFCWSVFFSSVYVLSRLVVLPLRFVFHLFFLFRLNYTLRSLVSYNVHRTDTRWIRTKQQQKIRPKRNYCCLFYVNYIHLLCKSIWSWFSCFLFILRLPHLRWSCDELVDGHWLCSGAMRVFTHTFRYLEI